MSANMNIIEQAAKRLEQLERAGVSVPWAAAGIEPQARAPLNNAAGLDSPLGAEPRSESVVAIATHGSVRPTIPSVRAEPKYRIELDLQRLRQAGDLVPDQIRSAMAEQFRHLKRPLLKAARAPVEPNAHSPSQIMVTSALPGEGKTFCASNLAMSMAMEVDTSVILVDADVLRPSVFARLGIDQRPPGLLDYLSGDVSELHDVLVETNIPKLMLMSSGEPNSRSNELLASDAMDRLLSKLDVEYSDCVVIFDGPPILVTTESTVLASKVGQVLVVVENGRTTRHAVQQAFAALRNCPVVMSVLNKCDETSDASRYGYGYYAR